MKDYLIAANTHIDAKISGSFTNPTVTSKEEMFRQVLNGETFEELLRQIEIRYVSTTSLLYGGVLGYVTDAYKKSVRRGFRELFKHARNEKI